MGDFNTQNECWNCAHTDINGARLQEEVNRAQLNLINDDKLTHIGEGRHRDSILDLIIANDAVINTVKHARSKNIIHKG